MGDKNSEQAAAYPSTGGATPGSLEYQAMDNLAKMFEKQVEEMQGPRGARPSPENSPR